MIFPTDLASRRNAGKILTFNQRVVGSIPTALTKPLTYTHI